MININKTEVKTLITEEMAKAKKTVKAGAWLPINIFIYL